MVKVLGLVAILLSVLAGTVLSYDRPGTRKNLVIHPSNEDDPTSPDQVHISLVGPDKMRISWITQGSIMPTVVYGTVSGKYESSANGTSSTYHYLLIYRSGQIHDVVIGPLKPNTVYYYKCGGPNSTEEFSLRTPPSKFPIKFAVSGDLGTSEWTKSTLEHVSKWDHDVFILPGDLSYANSYQPLWDTFGRLVQPLASQRPWMVTHGNHELEKIPILHHHPFTAYNQRWRMPFEESGSTSNLYYSFNVYGVHIIMLGSYTDFEPGSEQYQWLENNLKKIDRKTTPWVVAVVHAPWYNSNEAHQGEKESVKMKESMETLLYKARVDLVFAGHVHAYERFSRVYQDKFDKCGPVYINIGDGGNLEGLARKYKDPNPEISLFREANFGHGQLVVENATHAHWEWQRNDDEVSVQKDSVWLTSLLADSSCKI
ncbi:Purple acid phosphatase N-terminal [Arabidopsis thaliana x Arabidopsis arenosa]|uniref:acid phosphatase n=1 Tax=Arabidopsis thaliana x Arabidopsis arenosa TaxID=1240361 RepID=A0A8T1ZMJ9_9BRAS|nr:Purple acid phosphatase N-terminal [Arabidopsis thaliana x Arabidopsis arenosa]